MTKNDEKTLKIAGIVAIVGIGAWLLVRGINSFAKNKVAGYIDEDKSPAGSNFLKYM